MTYAFSWSVQGLTPADDSETFLFWFLIHFCIVFKVHPALKYFVRQLPDLEPYLTYYFTPLEHLFWFLIYFFFLLIFSPNSNPPDSSFLSQDDVQPGRVEGYHMISVAREASRLHLFKLLHRQHQRGRETYSEDAIYPLYKQSNTVYIHNTVYRHRHIVSGEKLA